MQTALMIPSHICETAKTVRMAGTNDNPLFCLADVCEVLSIANVSQVAGRLEEDERGICNVDTPSGQQNMLFVNEAGFYRILMTTRLKKEDSPEGKARNEFLRKFQRWVLHEVLPAIRRHGQYPPPASGVEEDPLLTAIEHTKQIRIAQLETERRLAETKRLAEQAQQTAMQAGQLAAAAYARIESNQGFFSIVGYLRRHRQTCSLGQSQKYARELGALCQQRGIERGFCSDERWGEVRTYPESLLDEYFGYEPACRRFELQ